MTFQSTVRFDNAFGVVGEIRYDGPKRAKPGLLNTTLPANNVIGRAFTLNGDGQTIGAGGTGTFWGILANPKTYAAQGTSAGGTLAPTLTLANNVEAEFVDMGFVIIQPTNTGTLIGMDVHFVQADGTLITVAAGTAPAAGNTKVPNATIDYVPQPNALGMAVVRLTN